MDCTQDAIIIKELIGWLLTQPENGPRSIVESMVLLKPKYDKLTITKAGHEFYFFSRPLDYTDQEEEEEENCIHNQNKYRGLYQSWSDEDNDYPARFSNRVKHKPYQIYMDNDCFFSFNDPDIMAKLIMESVEMQIYYRPTNPDQVCLFHGPADGSTAPFRIYQASTFSREVITKSIRNLNGIPLKLL